ncbi:MAG: trimethylamine methyltransferase family protein [Bacillota bacterium]
MSFSVQALPRIQLFNSEQCEAVHYATLDILRRTGTRVYHPEALHLLKEAGCLVSDQTLVQFPASLVEWALKQAPSTIVLCERSCSRAAFRLEAMNVAFGTGSDCRNYLDPRTGEQRLFTTTDIVDCVRLVDASDNLDFCMSMGIPSDLHWDNPYRYQFSLLIQNTSKPIVFVGDDRADCESIVAMASVVAGGLANLKLNPTILCYSQITTPLVHNRDSTAKLLYLAEVGIPIVHQPSPMMGGTAPMSMAGALAIGNAEVLSGLILHQLKAPGAPFLYGSGQHHMDMHTTISVYGAPEFDLGRIAVAEMARYYNLPSWGYAGCSDSCLFDEQAASDATASIMAAVLSGQNLVHDIGYMEAGMTVSPEMILFSNEIIGRMRAFSAGITLDTESFALDLIDEVGPGGTFLTAGHTFRHFRDFWKPSFFNRHRRGEWVSKGSLRMSDRIREKTIAIMDSHQPDLLSDQLREEITYIMDQ